MVQNAKTASKKDTDEALRLIIADESQRDVFRAVMRQVASNQAAAMTPEQKKIRAQNAANKRWEKANPEE